VLNLTADGDLILQAWFLSTTADLYMLTADRHWFSASYPAA
jgi:hypothetical protein